MGKGVLQRGGLRLRQQREGRIDFEKEG